MKTPARAFVLGADVLSVCLAGLAVYTSAFGVFDNAWVSGLSVGLGMVVLLLGQTRAPADRPGDLLRDIAHLGLALLFLWLLWRWLGIMLEQEEFFIEISDTRLMMGWLAFAIIGYATWRGFGLPMLLVYVALLGYILAPASLFGAGESWTRVAENLWYSTDGAFGRPVEVVSRVVLVFIVFGAVLQSSGAGAVLLKLAFAATGRFTGGPAHASIVGSALFGTISGAAVANVVSTGIFTIPIIKRAGFRPKFAGAVEAAASTGGQIMPPVMGVVAFLMADVTGIPYLSIVVAATLPAVFYYASLFMVVLVESRRMGIRPTPKAERERITRADWLQSLAFFLPLCVIIALLVQGRTAQFAGVSALGVACGMCLLLFPAFRRPSAWWAALVSAGRTSATLMVIVTAIGVVIGVINMTGVGLQFAQGILALSGDSLFLSLVLVMLGCLVMGMGVPSAPAYLIVALVMGPALERLGVPTIAAHLFMLYFGVLSVVTPPVGLAAFAAAPIAGSKPMETGFEALRLSIAGFIIPFLFVYHPDILIINGVTAGGLAWAVLCFFCATWMIATALSRFDARRLEPWEMALRLAAALAILWPGVEPSLAGFALALLAIGLHRLRAPQIHADKTLPTSGGHK
ncbi:TRAP transporter fused permease subunit (plasmid) [Paroceanicella profunda]|uniref:TRAP transporter fused permease subunit n=1 Tax=Paroceanicella profunda TaxID=2579971 RepID=A0A5B8FJ98_9RHOB|nr:TRAP transporter fused permease subunit [Paroceanicella profunda]QDL93998.1 TRAP transporter fused permease subunit [Paroceanicella profunda]